MVLAAGLGRRMMPLTADRPKPMVEALGVPLIDRTLDRLLELGVSRAVVNLHYLPGVLTRHLAGRAAPRLAFSDETDLLMDTGGGIAQALPQLGSAPFLAVNSDNIWTGARPLAALIEAWDDASMDALLLMVPRERAIGYTRAGDFELDEGRLRRRGEAPSAPYVFTGAQIVHPRAFADVPEGPFSMNLVWDRLIASDRARGVVQRGGWCDVGTPEGLRLAEAALAEASAA